MSGRIIDETGRDQLRWEYDLPQEDSPLKDEVLRLRRENEELKNNITKMDEIINELIRAVCEDDDE